MKPSKAIALGVISVVVLLATSISALAGDNNNRAIFDRPTYEVTITNITSNQVFSPPIVATHESSVGFFQLGQAASEELALMAEDGDNSQLAALLDTFPEVLNIVTADAPLPPGQSATFTIGGARRITRISAAGMLVNTNDAFFAIDTKIPPTRRFGDNERIYYAVAFDAGSEDNNEDCGFIPGPACEGAGAGVRDTEGAEGFVHVHDGIHGIADLAPDRYDWRNPVAEIIIVRVR